MIFILPETKGISLERVEKIFGDVDFEEVGERETTEEKIEFIAQSTAHVYGHVYGHDRGQIKREEAFDVNEVGKGTGMQLEWKELV